MPTYDYHCQNCGHREEKFQGIKDAPLTTCSQCQQNSLRRGPGGGVGLQFKGTGFYITDYARKGESSDPSPQNSSHGCPASACKCKGNS